MFELSNTLNEARSDLRTLCGRAKSNMQWQTEREREQIGRSVMLPNAPLLNRPRTGCIWLTERDCLPREEHPDGRTLNRHTGRVSPYAAQLRLPEV